MKVHRRRHLLEVELDLESDDPSEPDVIIEVLTKWIMRGVAADEKEFDVLWPESYRVRHVSETGVTVDVTAPVGGFDELDTRSGEPSEAAEGAAAGAEDENGEP
jgi:hypothetical protein